MGLLSHLSVMQDLRVQILVTVLIFAISISSGDVSLQNSYSISGSESRGDIYLHDMDYSNSAGISSVSYYASSQASPAEKSKDANFRDTTNMNSVDGAQGASLKIDADDLKYSRSISGGESNSITYSYFAESGISHAEYFTPSSTFIEDLSLINNKYNADFGVFNSESYSSGTGHSTVNEPSSLIDNIYMSYLDKYCNIHSFLNTGDEKSVVHPLSYSWDGFSSQRESFAVAGIDMDVIPGNRTASFGIEGKSSILEDKFSPDKNDTFPAHFNASGESADKFLIMQYRLNKTD